MALNDTFCESCLTKDKSFVATKLCTDCDERLCKECGNYHLGFKAFKSHHLIEISSVPTTMTTISTFEKNCNLHRDMILDFYCTHHVTTCCRMCLSETHRLCKNVIPLEVASKDIKNSTLLTETIDQIGGISKTLQTLSQVESANVEILEKSASTIKIEIDKSKRQFVSKLDALQKQLITKLNFTKESLVCVSQKKHNDIEKQLLETEERKREIQFLTRHGTNNQLFLALHKYDNELKATEGKINKLICNCKNTDIIYEQASFNMKFLGKISQNIIASNVQYTPIKQKQAQTKSDIRRKSLTNFINDCEIQLKQGEDYHLTDMAVNEDNMLLLCNSSKRSPKVYLYKDGEHYQNEITFSAKPWKIAIIPGTFRAVVVFHENESMQFFNICSMRKENKLTLRFKPKGVSATANRIFVVEGVEIKVFDTNGTFQEDIYIGQDFIGDYFSISLNRIYTEIIFRDNCVFACLDLTGEHLYSYDLNYMSGVAVDGKGHVYLGDSSTSEVHRLSPEGKLLDIVLTVRDGVNIPYAMTFNKNFNKLLIIGNDHKTVSCFASCYMLI